LCFDCAYKGEIKCPTCNEKASTFSIERNNGVCEERDKKHGLFECPACKNHIKRKDYFEHQKEHFCIECDGKTCKKIEASCGSLISDCYYEMHIKYHCEKCRETICQYCSERVDNGHHKTFKCPCDKFHNYACLQKGQIFIFDDCVVKRREFEESYTFDLTKFCHGCRFKCDYPKKHGQCEIVRLVRYILQNDAEDKKEYEKHQDFRNRLINAPFTEFEPIEPKKRKDTEDKSTENDSTVKSSRVDEPN